MNYSKCQIKIINHNIYTINNRILEKDTSFSDDKIKVDINQKVDSNLIHSEAKMDENTLNYLSEIPSIFPLNRQFQKLSISSNFSKRVHPISKKWAFHYGIDLPAAKKSLVYATANGIVDKIYQNRKTGIGYGIKLNHQFGYSSIYGHLLYLPKLSLNDSVSRGQVIGYVGNSGLSTGYHLHYAIYYKNKAVNPLIYCKLLEIL